MPRHIAFLRAINVGGHTVKMQVLRELFQSLGFSNVETVIASGNVVFESPEGAGRRLEQEIERLLKHALGFQVATFLRTAAELTTVVRQQPFDLTELGPDTVVYVIFLRNKPTVTLSKAVRALNTDNDQARVGKREVYWLRRKRSEDSEEFGARLGKVVGTETTMRNMTTVRKIVDKYCKL